MKDFKKYYLIPAPPDDVYMALTNPNTIHLWSGEEATMSTEPGSEFSLWEGSIVGRNIEFEVGRKIVQEWFFGESDNKSIVTFKLHDHKKGTSLELFHSNIPDEAYNEIVDGWNTVYFASLEDFYREE